MKIEVYFDESIKPFKVLHPPEAFKLDSINLPDGRHRLRFCVIENDAITSEREIEFVVQNGPNISLHGIRDGEIISGEVNVLANAYSSRIGDEFEPIRIENPVPTPTWAWVLCLIIFSWAVGYLVLEYGTYQINVAAQNDKNNPELNKVATYEDNALGGQIYGNYCASCHQADGQGLPGVFPPLAGNKTVLSKDKSDHIDVVLNGLKDKEIDGINYPSPMPGFGAQLSDVEVVAVVNHERTNWGNEAELASVDEVTAKR